MTLATHIVIAAAAAQPLAALHPAASFAAALATHYLADAVPHWDYEILSAKNREDKEKLYFEFSRATVLRDLARMAADGLIGVLAVTWFLWPLAPADAWWALAVIAGSCIPDFLQGVYYGLKKPRWLSWHQKLHDFFHSKIKLGPYPILGVPLQAAIFIIAALCLR